MAYDDVSDVWVPDLLDLVALFGREGYDKAVQSLHRQIPEQRTVQGNAKGPRENNTPSNEG
jgi:hypothetical protein